VHPSATPAPASPGAYVLGFAACLLTWVLVNNMPLASGSAMDSAPHSVTAGLQQRSAGFVYLTPPALNPQEGGALLLTICALFSGWLHLARIAAASARLVAADARGAIGDRPTLPFLAVLTDTRAG